MSADSDAKALEKAFQAARDILPCLVDAPPLYAENVSRLGLVLQAFVHAQAREIIAERDALIKENGLQHRIILDQQDEVARLRALSEPQHSEAEWRALEECRRLLAGALIDGIDCGLVAPAEEALAAVERARQEATIREQLARQSAERAEMLARLRADEPPDREAQ